VQGFIIALSFAYSERALSGPMQSVVPVLYVSVLVGIGFARTIYKATIQSAHESAQADVVGSG
jgi:hypothetical protein